MFTEFRQTAKKILKSKNATYSQVAEKTQLEESTIKGFMCGASDSRRVAEKIADYLNMTLSYQNGKYHLVCELHDK